MADILLTTLNARYTHSSIGLRYLYANMGELQSRTSLMEFVISDNPQDVAEKLLAGQPAIIGLGVYIWNATQTKAVVDIVKKVSPQTAIVLGGPEVSYSPVRVNFDTADFIIQGEGDIAFGQLCSDILSGHAPQERLIRAGLVDMASIELPYRFYSDEDVANRYIYVEASRGCPFLCEFCLSSIDKRVRDVDTDQLVGEFEQLWLRGVRSFKFIDRTFNLNMKVANRLLDFFLARDEPFFAHFEVIPDYFPESLKGRIAQFPPASLQLEVGIQTLNPEVAARIRRKLNIPKIEQNIAFLEKETAAHMHLDLIVGLPGESLESFGDNLNKLCALTDSEIQIGILKKLSGTTLDRHDTEFGMRYSDLPPYDLLQNDLIPFEEMQKMKRFARFWDLCYNSGNFNRTIRLLWSQGDVFRQFYAFAEWIYSQTRSTWKISLERLAELLFRYLTEVSGLDAEEAARMMTNDIMKLEGRKLPNFLKAYGVEISKLDQKNATGHNKRQVRHT